MRADEQWFEAESDVGAKTVETARQLEQRAALRRTMSAVYHRVATGREPAASARYAMSTTGAVSASFDGYQPPHFNALASVIESLTAGVAKSRPWIVFATSDAPLKERVRAKRSSKYVWGLFHKLDVYNKGRLAFISGLRLGLGALKVVYDDVAKEAKCEYVDPDELLWDDQEVAHSADGMPRQLFHRRFVDRYELAALFPEHAKDIEQAAGCVPGVIAPGGLAARYVALVEAWKRPGADGKAGRHVLAVGTTTLKDEPFEGPFPFAFFRGFEEVAGQFLGQGVTELGYGTQQALDRLYAVIDASQRRVGVPWVVVDEKAQVQTSTLGNRVAQVVKWNSGQSASAPQVVTHQSASADVYAHCERLKSDIYRRFGVSDMMAAAQRPAGIVAAEALRTIADASTARHVILGQRLEKFYVDVAKLLLAIAEKHKLVVDVGAKYGGSVSWSDVKTSSDPVAWPLSQLPLSPEGKIQRAEEWVQRGLIDRQHFASIMDWPDMGRATDLITASRDNIEAQLDDIVEAGDYRAPEPYQDLNLLVKMAQERLLAEETRDVPEAHLDLLRQLVDEADALRKALQPPPAPTPEMAPIDPNRGFQAGAPA